MNKIILVDKPSGITSFDVIRRLRRELNIKKMGHAGTLDPLASGLMIIGVDEGTKKLTDYVKLDKEYEAEILVGIKTETGDIEGDILEKKEISKEETAEIFSAEAVNTALAEMIGTLTLTVSAYSAIKKDGVPFYKKAREAKRRGQTIPERDLPVRDMIVYEAKLINTIKYDSANRTVTIPVKFKVSSGTYVRSLAEEFGRRFNYPATIQSLRRTKIGEFDLKDARNL